MEKSPTNSIVAKILTWLLRAFALGWSSWVFLDYLFFHPEIAKIIEWYPYWSFLFVSLIVFCIAAVGLKERPFKWERGEKWQFKKIRGGYLLLAILVLQLAFFQAFKGVNNEPFQSLDGSLIDVLGKLLSVQGAALILLLACFAGGRRPVNYLAPKLSLSSKRLLSIATGSGILIFAGLILASIGVFNMVSCWIVILGLIAWNYKSVWNFVNAILIKPLKSFELSWFYIPVVFVLSLLISVNALSIIRPVPFGFDALSLYMNLPKLLHEYGALVAGGQAYNWSIFMAYGFNLFDSTVITLYLSVVPGILAAIVVLRLAMLFLPLGKSILAAAVFYSSPIILWQSSFEAKVDLGLTFISCSILLLLFESLFSQQSIKKFKWELSFSSPMLRVLVLVGILSGIAFGIKYTFLFLFVAIAGLLVFASGGAMLWFGFATISIGLSFYLGLQKFSGLQNFGRMDLPAAIAICLGVLAISTGIFVRKRDWKPGLGMLFVLGAVFFLSFLPWPIKHIAESGEVSITSVIQGNSDLGPLDWQGGDSITGAAFNRFELYAQNDSINLREMKGSWKGVLKVYKKNPFSGYYRKRFGGRNLSGKREEINRYMGYESGAIRYLSLPYDNTMQVNVSATSTGIGPWILALLPLVLLFTRDVKRSLFSSAIAGFLILFLSISVFSVYNPMLNRGAISDFSQLEWHGPSWYQSLLKPLWLLGLRLFYNVSELFSGLYDWLSTTSSFESIIIGIVLFTLLAVYWWVQDDTKDRKLDGLLSVIALYFMFWWFFASGIAWYGMLLLAMVPIAVLYRFHAAPGRKPDWFIAKLIVVFFCFWLGLSAITRLANNNTSDLSQLRENNVGMTVPPLFAQYLMGAYGEEEAIGQMNIQYPKAMEYLNANPSLKVLRVGTYLNYFIESNDKRVYEDNQLEAFANLYLQSAGRKDVINKALNQQGIYFILMDLNAHQIDKTPDKSLTKKVQQMYSYIQSNPSVKLLVTDRIVVDPNGPLSFNRDGNVVKGKFSAFGTQIIQTGSFALFSVGLEQ